MFYRKSDVVKPTRVSTKIRLIDIKHGDKVEIVVGGERYTITSASNVKRGSDSLYYYNLVDSLGNHYLMHISHGTLFLISISFESNTIQPYSIDCTNLVKNGSFYTVNVDKLSQRGTIKGKPLNVGDVVDNRFTVKIIEDNYILLHSKSGMPKVINKDNTTSEVIYIKNPSEYIVSRFI